MKKEEKDLLSFTQNDEGIIRTDCNGYIEAMNKSASKTTGWMPAEAAGKPIDTVLSLIKQDSCSSLKQMIIDLIHNKTIKTSDL